MQDLTGPVWPAAIVIGGALWAIASWPGNEASPMSEMRTPALLLAAGGAAVGIVLVARRRKANDGSRDSGEG